MVKIICSVCNSDHCPETNIDGTDGCCVCYNKQMAIEESEEITLCGECEKYSSAYNSSRVLDNIIFEVKKKIGSKHL